MFSVGGHHDTSGHSGRLYKHDTGTDIGALLVRQRAKGTGELVVAQITRTQFNNIWQNLAIATAAYETEWFTFDIAVRRNILFMILRAQRPASVRNEMKLIGNFLNLIARNYVQLSTDSPGQHSTHYTGTVSASAQHDLHIFYRTQTYLWLKLAEVKCNVESLTF